MAKIRGIKPEFWTDEDIVELSRDARLLFIGMWNFACDNGHLADSPRQIKMRILPADDVDIEALLEELVKRDRIIRDGNAITIPKFAHHQKPHKRWWTTCDLPGCVLPEGAGQHVSHRGATVVPPVATSGPTADGDGEGDVDSEGDGDQQPAPQRGARGHRIDRTFTVTPAMRAWAHDKGFGHLDLDAITEEFVDYWIGVAGKQGIKADWVGTWRNRVRVKASDMPKQSRSAWDRAKKIGDGW